MVTSTLQENSKTKLPVYTNSKDAKSFNIEDLDMYLEIERLARLICKTFSCEDCGLKSSCNNKNIAAEILEYYKRK